MEYKYVTDNRVCSKEMIIDIENNVIKNVKIVGGCPGNTLGVTKLVAGMNIDDAIKILSGIPCGNRGTSCPDQLAKALSEAKEKNK